MKRHIPNLITLLNLLCGSIAVIQAVEGNLLGAAIWVVLGIFFDFFDGFFARLLHVKSDLGLQLDSLADMVTAGLVPAIVMYQLLGKSHLVVANDTLAGSLLPYFGLLIALASAYRLAKFNIDTRQSDGFIGLPTPANALLILSLPFVSFTFIADLLSNTWLLIGITLLSSYLLNAEIRLIALKFKNYRWADNQLKYLLILFSAVSLIVLRQSAVPLIILFYIGISVFAKAK
ncbi:MAG: CDP-alcohol phosphatidyltransferase family protein [Capnocytophaga sp.]|nr:CDP-alcohol phosphatidyltransferase family protein [Capnocytophaga sp.]